MKTFRKSFIKKASQKKATIGIAMAAIMVASVFVAMAPTGSAAPNPDSGFYPYPPPNGTRSITVIKGTEDVNISAWTNQFIPGQVSLTLVGAKDTPIEGETHSITNVSKFDVLESWSKGQYGVNASDSPYRVYVEEPKITTKVKLADGTDVTGGTIVEDQEFYVEVTTNFGAVLGSDETPATVDLKVINPDKTEITEDEYGVPFKRTNVTTDKIRYPAAGYYKLEDTGEYQITAKTPSPGVDENNKLEISADSVTLSITTKAVTIDVENAEVTEGEDVIVTGTGKSKTFYSLEIDSDGGFFKTGVKDVYPGEKATADHHNHTPIPGENVNESRFAAVKTNDAGRFRAEITTSGVDTGSYTVYVEKDTPDEDKKEYRVKELEVTLESDKPTYVIGEDATISGVSPSGDYIIVAIDDTIMSYERIKADDTFEYKWTETDAKISGSYKVEVWNVPVTVVGDITSVKAKYPVGTSSEAIPQSADATITIYLTEPELTAGVSKTDVSPLLPEVSVALGDEFWVRGEAPGADNVLVLAVSPKGSGGTMIDTGTFPGLPSIYASTVSVSSIDYTYEHKISVHEDSDAGTWIVAVLCPGKDEIFNGVGATISEFLDPTNPKSVIKVYDLDTSSKTQEQILSILGDATFEAAGSDDLAWVGHLKAEEGKVTLGAIADVAVGEPLVVNGTTNRKEGFPIVITVKSAAYEIPAKTSYVEEGTFSATFDTTDAPVGTYTVKADDGDGHTDTATVNIQTAAPTPTPSPTPTATPTPSPSPSPSPVASPTPTPSPSPSPSPTPKPPGFEAVFAISGLLAVAYLVLRRRK